MIRHRRKMLPILLLIKVGVRKRIRLYGNNYELRERKYVRDSATAIFAGCLRPLLRERAKHTMMKFLTDIAAADVMVAKVRRFGEIIRFI